MLLSARKKPAIPDTMPAICTPKQTAVILLTLLMGLPMAWGFPPESPRELVEQYVEDAASLKFRYRNPNSEITQQRMTRFYSTWQTRVAQVDFESLDTDAKIDILLLRNQIRQRAAELEDRLAKDKIARRLLPFLDPINQLLDEHEATRETNPQKVAETFAAVTTQVDSFDTSVIKLFSTSNPVVIVRAIRQLDAATGALDEYHRFHLGYDPGYSWWVEKPYEALQDGLKKYKGKLEGGIYGDADPASQIVGEPIGRKRLEQELKHALIPYTVDELIDIANQEMIWCDNEMRIASRALGYTDWKEAQNAVKNRFVKPGDQPKLINDLAQEAVNFLELNNLITIPSIAKESWRMGMMSPARQKMSPYFLGGHTILVSYPKREMSHMDKMMSMRGNNPHFARATVHHELIPGHHLQYFMNKRHKPYRQAFGTPFWLEGWAVYWEMLLWDLGFAKSNEDRIGMLFWRKHRCARIVFSLSYHAGEMPAEECIEYLIDRVGHEPNNARAEVRRSVMGGYGPLYQAAYMIGALQFRKLHEELVQSGKMTNREFHDAVLKENSIPVELLRAKLLKLKIDSDFQSTWRFSNRIE